MEGYSSSKEWQQVLKFCAQLKEEEKSKATIEKYKRDVKKFLYYVQISGITIEEISKQTVMAYKEELMKIYEASSVNSMLAALNQFLDYQGKGECKVKRIKIQRQPFVEEEKCLTMADVQKLLRKAKEEGKLRLCLVMETLYGTGIRVSELADITVERLQAGMVKIYNKGKMRVIAMTKALRKKLLRYAKAQRISKGPVFITKSGKSLDRSNLWREIKILCGKANIALQKGFPHNFRHLFARCFYEIDKDLVNLADILGHNSIETTRIYVTKTYVNYIKKLEMMKYVLE